MSHTKTSLKQALGFSASSSKKIIDLIYKWKAWQEAWQKSPLPNTEIKSLSILESMMMTTFAQWHYRQNMNCEKFPFWNRKFYGFFLYDAFKLWMRQKPKTEEKAEILRVICSSFADFIPFSVCVCAFVFVNSPYKPSAFDAVFPSYFSHQFFFHWDGERTTEGIERETWKKRPGFLHIR